MEEQFVEALNAKNWYAIAALVVFGVIFFVKKSPWAPKVWDVIPDQLKWLGPILLGAATGFVDAFQAGLPWQQALIKMVAGAVFIGGVAMGVHSAIKGGQSNTG